MKILKYFLLALVLISLGILISVICYREYLVNLGKLPYEVIDYQWKFDGSNGYKVYLNIDESDFPNGKIPNSFVFDVIPNNYHGWEVKRIEAFLTRNDRSELDPMLKPQEFLVGGFDNHGTQDEIIIEAHFLEFQDKNDLYSDLDDKDIRTYSPRPFIMELWLHKNKYNAVHPSNIKFLFKVYDKHSYFKKEDK